MQRMIQLILYVAVLAATAAPGQAEIITFHYSGTVESLDFTNGTPTEFAPGDTISGTYTFDSTTTDTDSNPGIGVYVSSISSLSTTVGSYTASFVNSEIVVQDNFFSASDFYQISGGSSSGPSVSGIPLNSFSLWLNDTTGTMFSNDSLPLIPTDPATVPGSPQTFITLSFFGSDSGGPNELGAVYATLDTLTLVTEQVPEPSTYAGLLGITCVSLLAYGWRRNRQQAV